jgi:hypothetical protein
LRQVVDLLEAEGDCNCSVVVDMAEGNLNSIEEVYHFQSSAFHHSGTVVDMPDMVVRNGHQELHLVALMGMLMWADTVAVRPHPPIDLDAQFQETQDPFQYWVEVK